MKKSLIGLVLLVCLGCDTRPAEKNNTQDLGEPVNWTYSSQVKLLDDKLLGVRQEESFLLEDTKENIEAFFGNMARIERDYQAKVNKLKEARPYRKDKEIEKSKVEKNSYLTEMIRQIKALDVPASCEKYKSLMINSLETRLEAARLSQSIRVTSDMSVKVYKNLYRHSGAAAEREKSYQYTIMAGQEYHRILDQFNITDQKW